MLKDRNTPQTPSCFLTAILLVLLCTSGLNLQAQGVRKYSNDFLSIGVGARALAMSGSVASSVSGVEAAYWNPAGLTGITSDFEVAGMHAEYFAGLASYDYAAIAMPLSDKNRFLGISMVRFGVDDIPNTLFLFEPDGSINYDNITAFSVADYGFFLTYAQKLKIEGLSLGGSVKVIYRNAGNFATAWGFGVDLGLQYQKNNFRLGVQARDLTSTFNAWSFDFTPEEAQVLEQTGNVIPESSYELTAPRVILGVGYNWDFAKDFGLFAEANFDLTMDGKRNVLVRSDAVSLDPHLGIEFDYDDFIFLRAGMGNIQQAVPDDDTEEAWVMQPNMGLGLKIKFIHLDYAYTNIGNRDQLLYSNIFSLKLDLNRKAKGDREN